MNRLLIGIMVVFLAGCGSSYDKEDMEYTVFADENGLAIIHLEGVETDGFLDIECWEDIAYETGNENEGQYFWHRITDFYIQNYHVDRFPTVLIHSEPEARVVCILHSE